MSKSDDKTTDIQALEAALLSSKARVLQLEEFVSSKPAKERGLARWKNVLRQARREVVEAENGLSCASELCRQQ